LGDVPDAAQDRHRYRDGHLDELLLLVAAGRETDCPRVPAENRPDGFLDRFGNGHEEIPRGENLHLHERAAVPVAGLARAPEAVLVLAPRDASLAHQLVPQRLAELVGGGEHDLSVIEIDPLDLVAAFAVDADRGPV